MTRAQADAIIEVIEKDATLRCRYRNENNTEQCVIGGLAKAAGFDLFEIPTGSLYESVVASYFAAPNVFKMVKKVSRHFDISSLHLQILQEINDRRPDLKQRRQALINQVNEWVEK